MEFNDIALAFKLLLSEPDKKARKAKEIDFIGRLKPEMQSGIGDRVKPIEDMISKMRSLLDERSMREGGGGI